jgi:hypothetical protein
LKTPRFRIVEMSGQSKACIPSTSQERDGTPRNTNDIAATFAP